MSAENAANRILDVHFTASEFHVIGDYSSVTAPDDPCAAPDICCNNLIHSFTMASDIFYDSDFEVSETQFDTSEIGEMSQDDESVSVSADRALPSDLKSPKECPGGQCGGSDNGFPAVAVQGPAVAAGPCCSGLLGASAFDQI